MKKKKNKSKKNITKVFYKDIFKHKYRLVFPNIRHTAKKNTGAIPDPKQVTRISKIIDIIKKYNTEEHDKIFNDYMRLFRIPENDTLYYIVPKDCPIRKFRWAVSKYNSTINDNKIDIDKTMEIKSNDVAKRNYPSRSNFKNKNEFSSHKQLLEPRNSNINISKSNNKDIDLIEIPDVNTNEIITDNIHNFTKGDSKPPNKYINTIVKKRNVSITRQLKHFYNNTCQICNKKLEASCTIKLAI